MLYSILKEEREKTEKRERKRATEREGDKGATREQGLGKTRKQDAGHFDLILCSDLVLLAIKCPINKTSMVKCKMEL